MTTSASPVFRVFVCSTFEDLAPERNELHESVFPRLRRLCRERGAHFQAIDLRWGISPAAARENRTIPVCLEEVRRSRASSPHLYFLLLLGTRYGSVLPPPEIDAAELEEILRAADAEERRVIGKWYSRDDNAVPSSYRLRPWEEPAAGGGDWGNEQAALLGALQHAAERAMPELDPRRRKYRDSVLHHEIRAALEDPSRVGGILCYLRDLADAPAEADDQRERVRALKQEIAGALPPQQVFRQAASQEELDSGSVTETLCERIELDLRRVIEEETDSAVRVSQHEREDRAHHRFAHLAHYCADVREIQVDQTRHYHQICYATNAGI